MLSRLAALSVLLLSGCISPYTTRLPELATRDPESERRAYQVQDPFPDSRTGPSVGFRPLGFEDQRPEPQIAKDRGYSGFLRWRNQEARRLSAPGTVVIGPPLPPGSIAMPPQSPAVAAPPQGTLQPLPQ